MTGLCIIGDVHGEVRVLERLLKILQNSGHLVFVGDLVNRGENSREVVEIVSDLVSRGVATAIVGNHEIALLGYLDIGNFLEFARHDGVATIRSYVGNVGPDVHANFRKSFPYNHEAFLRSLAPAFETDEVLVTHAGLDPLAPANRDVSRLISGGRAERLSPIKSKKTIVFGHFPQRRVTRRGDAICIDTGCGYGGPLSCLMWPSLDVVSTARL